MFDTSQLLTTKIATILQLWLEAVRQDKQIDSIKDLSQTALGNSLPILLDGMVKALAHPEKESLDIVVETCLNYDLHRAKEGYDAAEIVREYSILRRVIVSVLEAPLLTGSPQQIMRTFRLIDAVIDEALSQCFNRYVEERLRELEQLRSQLSLNNQELTRLVRASQENLSFLAHEIKTPLTAIIGYSDLFLRQHRQYTSSENSLPNLKSIERVLNGGRQLLHLVNDALEIACYNAGKMELHLVSTDVCSVISKVVETIEPLVQAKNLQLRVDCDSTSANRFASRAPTEVLTDPFRLQQILTNLLSNAVRYTDTGFIELTCLTQPDTTWSIIVTDTGIGIDPDDQARIFEPYARAFNNLPRRDGESTGLGLAIVARLVKLLQGEIQLVSQVGVGSTFRVIFPLEMQANHTFVKSL